MTGAVSHTMRSRRETIFPVLSSSGSFSGLHRHVLFMHCTGSFCQVYTHLRVNYVVSLGLTILWLSSDKGLTFG